MPHVGQDMLTLSWTPDVPPFGEFMISPIHYLSVLGLCLRINDSGLFAWISLTAVFWTYFALYSNTTLYETLWFGIFCIILRKGISCMRVPTKYVDQFLWRRGAYHRRLSTWESGMVCVSQLWGYIRFRNTFLMQRWPITRSCNVAKPYRYASYYCAPCYIGPVGDFYIYWYMWEFSQMGQSGKHFFIWVGHNTFSMCLGLSCGHLVYYIHMDRVLLHLVFVWVIYNSISFF